MCARRRLRLAPGDGRRRRAPDRRPLGRERYGTIPCLPSVRPHPRGLRPGRRGSVRRRGVTRAQAARAARRAYGHIRGYSSTTDPHLLAGPDTVDGTALRQAARLALERADTAATELGAVFGDGLATEVDDIP
jgi:hypothetical protein